MSDEKFEFTNDEEIRNILGKQPEDETSDTPPSAETNEPEKIMTDTMLEDILSYTPNEPSYQLQEEAEQEEKKEIELSPVDFEEFVEDMETVELSEAGLKRFYDIPIEVSVVLGSAVLGLNKLSQLRIGSTIALKKLAGEPVEIFVGGVLVAKGEIYVVENEPTFAVMLTEILSERERLELAHEMYKKY